MKRTVSVILALSLVFILYLPAAGAEVSVSEYAALLERKYGITITYDIQNGKPAITVSSLETLDKSLSNMTETLVRQVSAYYEKINGKKIDITYITTDGRYVLDGGDLMAAFEQKTSKIYIFMPSHGGEALISGENPIAFVHEFGHAFHAMAQTLYGRSRMLEEWTAFNKGHRYNRRLAYANPDDTVFVSAYSTYSFEEDFAEVFAHVFVRNAPGTGFRNRLSQNSVPTGLGQKVAYMERMIKLVLKDTDEAISNYRRIYETPTSIKFEGLTFSGEYLQYSGYPQPRNILKGILTELGRQSKKSTWIRSIGAWRVIDRNDEMLYVFPGGTWASSKSVQVREAA